MELLSVDGAVESVRFAGRQLLVSSSDVQYFRRMDMSVVSSIPLGIHVVVIHGDADHVCSHDDRNACGCMVVWLYSCMVV